MHIIYLNYLIVSVFINFVSIYCYLSPRILLPVIIVTNPSIYYVENALKRVFRDKNI